MSWETIVLLLILGYLFITDLTKTKQAQQVLEQLTDINKRLEAIGVGVGKKLVSIEAILSAKEPTVEEWSNQIKLDVMEELEREGKL